MKRVLLILALFLAPLTAVAEEVVAGLSQNRISITTNFDGSEILVFGAVKRETAIPDGPPLHVIVAIAGPSEPVTVRKKARRLGIWVNAAEAEIDRAPSFYSVATSGPWPEVLDDVDDFLYEISIPRAVRSLGGAAERAEAREFGEALIRIRREQGLYQTQIGAVEITDETLFRTNIVLPPSLTEGAFSARIFLTRGGSVIDSFETAIPVSKVGLERFLYNLAQNQPAIYGLMSLAIAIAAGWSASAVFRYLRS